MSDHKFSDEFLNAFVDDQLAPEEKARVYPLINADKALNQRVCELRKTRDLVQLAYKNPPAAKPATARPVHHRFRGNVAAGLLLAIGVALGWTLRDTGVSDRPTSADERAAYTESAPGALTRASEVKIVLHLNKGSSESMRDVLDEAESVIQFYRDQKQAALVEVITNGDGLSLLRADKSPYAQRIARMQKQYDNLVFAACQNTIDRLKREQGIQAQLLPEAIVIDSGVAQIIMLQQQGWAYIQV